MRRLFGPMVALLLPFSAAAAPNPEAKGLDEATFHYTGQTILDGTMQGSCVSGGIIFPRHAPSGFAFESEGGIVEHYVTDWWGSTLLPDDEDPIHSRLWANQSRSVDVVPAGPGRVSWNESGRVRVFGDHWLDLDHYPEPDFFAIRFNLTNGRLSPVNPSVDQNREHYFEGSGGIVSIMQGGIWGWQRLVESPGSRLDAEGHLTFYLQEASLSVEAGYEYTTPAYQENATVVGEKVVKAFHYRFHHSIVRLRNATAVMRTQSPTFACGALQADVNGTLVVYGAKGNVHKGNRTVPFNLKELTLGGTFWVQEEPGDVERRLGARGWMESEADGEFQVVGLDFEPVLAALPKPQIDLTPVILWSAALLALGGILWKAGVPFFTRLQKGSAQESPARAQIVQSVQAQGWQTLDDLSRATGLKRGGTRYHVGALLRLGLLTRRRVGRNQLHGLPSQVGNIPEPATAFPRTVRARIMDVVGPDAIRFISLVGKVQELRPASKVAVWKQVQKLAARGLVRIERKGREVWVRSAD